MIVALAAWVVVCGAVALAAVVMAGVLVSVVRDGVAEDFVVLAALGGLAPWIVAVILWRRASRLDFRSRLAGAASGAVLSGFLAVAMMFVVAVLGDTTGTARF